MLSYRCNTWSKVSNRADLPELRIQLQLPVMGIFFPPTLWNNDSRTARTWVLYGSRAQRFRGAGHGGRRLPLHRRESGQVRPANAMLLAYLRQALGSGPCTSGSYILIALADALHGFLERSALRNTLSHLQQLSARDNATRGQHGGASRNPTHHSRIILTQSPD